MNKQKQTRRVSRAKLRELLTATVDEICAAQDKVTLSLTGNTFGIHLYGATINFTVNEKGGRV